jgi:hypothetical protein
MIVHINKSYGHKNLPSHIPSIDSSTSSLNIDLSHVDRREMGLRENN